jgi:hypothetical protein
LLHGVFVPAAEASQDIEPVAAVDAA